MRSLKVRLLAGSMAGTFAVLAISGWSLFGLIQADWRHEFDRALMGESRALTTLVEVGDGRVQSEVSEHVLPGDRSGTAGVEYAIWGPDQELIDASAGFGDVTCPDSVGTLTEPAMRTVTVAGGRRMRELAFRFRPRDEEGEDESEHHAGGQSRLDGVRATLVTRRDTSELESGIGRLRFLMVLVLTASVALSALLTLPIVTAGLRPLKTLSQRIASLDTQGLDERLDPASAPTEIRAVIDCLNGLLARLHDAFQRERAFSANVAHELRTPLAGLRATIEVALAKPEAGLVERRALTQCLQICKQAGALTENLLTLARLDSDQWPQRTEPVAIGRLLSEVWDTLADGAAQRNQVVEWDVDPAASYETDPQLLSLVFRNLLENAICHADPDSRIQVSVTSNAPSTEIVIRNVASEMPASVDRNAFDRFWRGDLARGGTGQHAGLGLALCREAMRVLGGQILVEASGGAFTATVRFPGRSP